MRNGATALAGVALIQLVVCLPVAACGIDASGLGVATVDGAAPPSTSDASVSKDTGGVGSDSTGSEGELDAGTGDTPTASDVQQSVEGASQDAPSLVDVVPEGPPPTCTGCNPNQCCNNGTCANIGSASCGDPGQPCVDCTNSLLGNQCLMVNGHQACGCAGPNSSNQCPMNNACFSMQCGTSCDYQHPCNVGCCSGKHSSTCVAGCEGGTTCMGNYCH